VPALCREKVVFMLAEKETTENEPCIRWDTAQAPAGRAGGQPTALCYARAKGTVDFTLSLVLLVLTAPLVLFAVALVKLTSRGPAFYSQTRVGRNGLLYAIYKIRTMAHNCESRTGPRWSVPGDPRITRVGRFLRKTHLDELPQLWNVLRGEMSLVGPRPERPEFVMQLEQIIPRYRERLSVHPGVTGLAQIQLPPDTDLESVRRKIAYDVYYVAHMSPWLDLQVLLGTGFHVLGVPFSIVRRLLGLPGGATVERAYHVQPPAPHVFAKLRSA
jgi:lipopolysaccharide/colanic/teichoic acid biosynthesis glycosyltransferase